MKIEELEKEMEESIETIEDNWKKCEDVEAIPEITQIALRKMKESIIKYLKENK